MTILIADDNPRFRAMIRTVLANTEPEFHECRDGAEAVEAYSHLHPHLVLMDVRMPTLDGLAATRIIRARDRGACIVILTDYDDRDIRQAAIAAGARAFVPKDQLLHLADVVGAVLTQP